MLTRIFRASQKLQDTIQIILHMTSLFCLFCVRACVFGSSGGVLRGFVDRCVWLDLTALSALHRLTTLWLHENELTSIPYTIGNLVDLTHITLHTNQLASLPFEMCNLTKLRQLALESNPLNSPPTQLARQTKSLKGLLAVLSYLRRFLRSRLPPHKLDLAGVCNAPSKCVDIHDNLTMSNFSAQLAEG